MTGSAALEGAAVAVAEARAQLLAAGAGTEVLARWARRKRMLGMLGSEQRLTPVGTAWRLGVLLLPSDPGGVAGWLAAGGSTTRAIDDGPRGYTAASARERGELRAAALRGGAPEGATVALGWVAVPLDGGLGPEGVEQLEGPALGPVLLRGHRLLVRWAGAGAPPAPFEGYLRERLALALEAAAR